MDSLLTGILSLCLLGAASAPATVGVGDATDFSYHARFSLYGSGRHAMTLHWPDAADSARYSAVAEIAASDFDDPLFPAKARYTIIKTKDNATRIVTEGDFEYSAGREHAFSMVLRRTAAGAALSLGADKADATVAVPFSGDSIRAFAAEGAEIERHSLIIRSIDKRAKAPFDSREELMSYLAASSDPMEGVWEYLDRDINPSEARLGGKYTIATMLAPDGYDIIYLDGAASTSGDWTCLDIKGKLKDTAFDGHYDLLWLAAPRHEADSEASAALSVGGEVLELTFPTLRSRLRFRRSR